MSLFLFCFCFELERLGLGLEVVGVEEDDGNDRGKDDGGGGAVVDRDVDDGEVSADVLAKGDVVGDDVSAVFHIVEGEEEEEDGY